MALPATDTFTSASDQALATYSANWTVSQGGFTVLGATDDVYPSTSDVECAARWTADTFDAAQYSQAVASSFEATVYAGVSVRCGASTWYGYYGNGTDSYLLCYSSGYHQLGSTGGAWTTGKTYRLEVTTDGSGNAVLVAKEDGTTKFNVTDSTYKLSSGAPGLAGYHTSGAGSGGRVDTWEGGNLTSNVTATPGQASVQLVGQAPPLALQVATGVGAVQLATLAPTATVGSYQWAYPASDVFSESWTNELGQTSNPPTVNLYASVDEADTANDSDYVRSPASPTGQELRLGLGALSTPDTGTVTLRVRARWVS